MMLTQRIKDFLGGGTPEKQAQQRLELWRDWVSPIEAGPTEAGDDISYDDDFEAVKEEVTKVSGTDDDKIISLCEALIRGVSKDLRPAVYYAYGRLRRDGLAGLCAGLELTAALLFHFPETIRPLRPESRKTALAWLASPTVTERVEQLGYAGRDSLDTEHLKHALAAVALINKLCGTWENSHQPDFTNLVKAFEELLDGHIPGLPENVSQAGSAIPTAAGHSQINSMRDVLDYSRQIAVFLRNQEHGYLAAFRLLRAARWDVLAELPPYDEAGKTRLTPPRGELRQHLKRLLLQQQWNELLERVEMAFAEAVNHFWLDLQYYAWQAQGQAGPQYAVHRDMLLTDLAQMLDRLPGLSRLSFNDGFPFAEDATLEWLAANAQVLKIEGGEKGLLPLPVPGLTDEWVETENQAQDLASSSSLEAAFAWLRDLPRPRGESHRVRMELLMAKLADQSGRPDMSISLYENLLKNLEKYRLDAWEPDLAFEICLGLFQLLERKSARKNSDKATLAERMENLVSTMTAIDPVRTLVTFPPEPNPCRIVDMGIVMRRERCRRNTLAQNRS